MAKNYLMLCPSLYRENTSVQYFSSSYAPELLTEAYHTNAPTFHHLTTKLAKRGEHLDAVMMLASSEVCNEIKLTELGELTTEAYLKVLLANYEVELGYEKHAQFSIIEVQSGEIVEPTDMQRMVETALAEFDFDEERTNLWIDFTSGLRSHAIAIVFIARFLERDKNYRVEDMLYANMKFGSTPEFPNTVQSCLAVYSLFQMYQFMTFPALSLPSADTPERTVWDLQDMKRKLDKTLSNTACIETGMLENARKLICSALDKYSNNSYVCHVAYDLQNMLPDSNDILASIEYLLSIGLVSVSLKNVYELAFRYLVIEGVITFEVGSNLYDKAELKQAQRVENDVVAGYSYYNKKFIPYMRGFLRRLREKRDLVPSDTFETELNCILQTRYNTHSLHSGVSMSDSIRRNFEKICGKECRKLDNDTLHEVQKIFDAKDEGGSEVTLGEVKTILQKYQDRKKSYEQIYMQTGFPLACTDVRGKGYSFDFYQKDLLAKTRKFLSTLTDMQSGDWEDSELWRLDKYQLRDKDYDGVLQIYSDHVEEFLPLSFSFESKGFNHWRCSLSRREEFHEFLMKFLPLHDKIRQVRNRCSHMNGDQAQMSQEEKEELEEYTTLVEESIRMLREINQRPREEKVK